MLSRAYSFLEVRSVSEDERVIRGVATTAATDRMGDIIEPLGVKFKNPMPLLHQHRADQPVGTVRFSKPTADGVEFEAKLPKITDPGPLKDRVDTAWGEIKNGLVRAVSIGFNAIEDGWERMKSGGIRFTEIEVLELSLVTIPANHQALIHTVKSLAEFDTRAALGSDTGSTSPGASGTRIVHITPPKQRDKMNYADAIKGFEATLLAKQSERDAVQEKASNEGRTKDAAERESFETLGQEIDALSVEIADLRKVEKEMVSRAKPVGGNGTAPAAESRSPILTVKAPEKLDKGIEAARFVMCVAAAAMTGGGTREALSLMEQHYPQQVGPISVLKAASQSGMSLRRYLDHGITTKGNVSAGTTTDSTWALPLVAYNQFSGDFLEYLRPKTIIGQFGQNGIPSLRRIPFNVHIRGQTSGGTGYWVGEGKPKPVTKFDFNDTLHPFHKVAAISVLTEELIRFSDPSAEMLVRDALAGALIQRIDTTFIDYNQAAVSTVSPAAITNGITPILSAGDTEANIRTDIGNLWQAGIDANLPLTDAVYVTTPSIALALSLFINSLGQRVFPDITMRGGTILGVPVIVSNNVPAGQLALVFASEIWLSDDGAVTVDASREASIQMLDNPTNNPVTPTATDMVSMFQTNSVALRAERFITWSKRRNTAVALLRNVSWGGAEES